MSDVGGWANLIDSGAVRFSTPHDARDHSAKLLRVYRDQDTASKVLFEQRYNARHQSMTINPRKLAAIDIVFLGSKLIIAEFASGVLLSAALGGFVLFRSHSLKQTAIGLYLISLGINYVPMLMYAVAISLAGRARAELGDELADRRQAMAKYRRQSLWLLIPFAIPIIAIVNLKGSRRTSNWPSGCRHIAASLFRPRFRG